MPYYLKVQNRELGPFEERVVIAHLIDGEINSRSQIKEGINGTFHKIEFSKFVKIPDFSKVPDNQRPLFNPELQLSSIYFFQEVKRPGVTPDKEKLEPLAEEMYANLAKAKFLLLQS